MITADTNKNRYYHVLVGEAWNWGWRIERLQGTWQWTEELFSFSDNEWDTINLKGGLAVKTRKQPKKWCTTFQITITFFLTSVKFETVVTPCKQG